jgi:hypothetical protein
MARRRRASATIVRMIEEATVDAYNEAEQETGFLTMIEENLRCPFPARVVGEEVQVVRFDIGPGDRGIVAHCRRGGRRYAVGVLEFEWPSRPPDGARWIDAYRAWLKGAW